MCVYEVCVRVGERWGESRGLPGHMRWCCVLHRSNARGAAGCCRCFARCGHYVLPRSDGVQARAHKRERRRQNSRFSPSLVLHLISPFNRPFAVHGRPPPLTPSSRALYTTTHLRTCRRMHTDLRPSVCRRSPHLLEAQSVPPHPPQSPPFPSVLLPLPSFTCALVHLLFYTSLRECVCVRGLLSTGAEIVLRAPSPPLPFPLVCSLQDGEERLTAAVPCDAAAAVAPGRAGGS